MASPSRPVGAIAELRSLLTTAERKLLEATTGSVLAKASQKQVQSLMTRARLLRDKWRDLHAAQSRSTKRTKDRGAANARSREKAELFAGAVTRLEERLAAVEGAVVAAVRGGPSRAAGKASRQAKQRSARTGLRTELRRAAAMLSSKPAVKPAAKLAKPQPAAPAAPAASTAAAKSRAARPAVRKPIVAASKKKLAATGTGQHIAFDVGKQRKARAAATVARLKFDGQVTRRGGHMLARGQRSQARRDGRTR
jgi:predicted component of type VI protein secretion system